MAPNPGDNPLQGPGGHPTPPADIFGKPGALKAGGGGGGGKSGGVSPGSHSGGAPKKVTPAPAEPEKEVYVEPPKPKPAAPKVTLSNLKWGAAKANFNDKIDVSVQAVVPDDIAHLSKIDFQLIALTPDGKREKIDKQSGNLVGGKANKDVTLFFPQYKDNGKLLGECKYVFTAKHKESKEEQSAELTVKQAFATNFKFEREEGWVGEMVKLTADTGLADDVEVDLSITVKTTKAVVKKIKAKAGKLVFEWTPCLCGIGLQGGAYPEQVDVTAELTHAGDKAAAAKKYKLKAVKEAAAENFTHTYTWNGFTVTSFFDQKAANGAMKIIVKRKIIKAWIGYYVDLTAKGITGTAGGCPWAGHRWARVTGVSEDPNQYYDGATWKPMPAGVTDFSQPQGFVKVGAKYLMAGKADCEWPGAFTDYNFDATALANKRAVWITDTDTRWTDKALLRPASCPKGVAAGGCGLKVDMGLTWDKVAAVEAGVIYMARENFRSNASTFSMVDPDDNMVAHEVGHLVGLPDEYADGATDVSVSEATDGLVSGIDTTSVMGNSMDKVKKRHYVNFLAMAKILFKTKTGKDTEFKAVYAA